MNKRLLLVAIIAGIASVFLAAGLYAGTKVDDVIKLKSDIYKEHKKGIVEFTHKKHVEEYGAKCGECHHDKEGKPLSDLKEGDEVQKCSECHSKPGEVKGKKARGMSDAEKLEYHAHALHENCKNCHKEYNKKNKTRAAPTTCSKCHPRDK